MNQTLEALGAFLIGLAGTLVGVAKIIKEVKRKPQRRKH